MLLPHGTVVAVVDGRTLALYRNLGNEAEPKLAAMDAPSLDEQNNSAGMRHFSSAANPTGHQLQEDAHAAAVADWLSKQVSERNIAHLVVIAAPRTLGEMRPRYGKPLLAALTGELHKDFVGCSAKEILEALQA
jgi:protein required for attachment to host cells